MPKAREQLTVNQILAWADAHHRKTGSWPRARSTQNPAPGISWNAIHWALYLGHRGLPGGSSLPRLLAAERDVRGRGLRKPLAITTILKWADEFHRRTGAWPNKRSGVIPGADGTTWAAIDQALYQGTRGLTGSSSLPMLLHQRRRAPTRSVQEQVTIEQILRWADAHHRRTGRWPTRFSGRIRGSPSLNWSSLNAALRNGAHGLPGGSSLPQVLADHRQVPNRRNLPRLSVHSILEWADAHHRATGKWPTQHSGLVIGEPGEAWNAIHSCLHGGHRGLPAGTSLAVLLMKHRGVRSKAHAPRLTIAEILRWADEHHRRTGRWPSMRSGPVFAAPDETWGGVHFALYYGNRGLPGGSALARVLTVHRGARNRIHPPPLSIEQILEWADDHHRRTGRWPGAHSGPIAAAPGESWNGVSIALFQSGRGLRGRTTLTQLLSKHRGVYNQMNPPKLSIRQIVEWADVHYQHTGDWPSRQSGRVLGAEQEHWSRINKALQFGKRGLPGGSTLVRLFSRHRSSQYARRGIPLTCDLILEWATTHQEFTGELPTERSGLVRGVEGENWQAIDASLRTGSRNLKGRISLAEFLERHYVEPYAGIGQRLSERLIIRWAREFRDRAGFWPTKRSAYVAQPGRGKDGEKWAVIDAALREGLRGLAGGSSLDKLLRAHRATG